ncbi:MAG: diguanylate cyclase [Lachnospiraceae bacterium]|nr:diguanylate cyclase [Lachnospiraceae bacterium]
MKHILVVDLVTTNLKCAIEILKDQYKVTTSRTEINVLDILKDEIPDLILYDINVLNHSPEEALKWKNAQKDLAHIPVIVQSTVTNEEMERNAISWGAVDYIYKPYQPDELLQKVEDALRWSEEHSNHINMPDMFRSYKMKIKQIEDAILQSDKGSFILISVNQFDSIGDKFGKLIGDELVYEIMSVLLQELEYSNNLTYLGEGQFVIYLAGVTEYEKLRQIVRRIMAGVEYETGDKFFEQIGMRISLCAGISMKPKDGNYYTPLYEGADKAVYYLNQSTKRGYHFYNADPSEQLVHEERKDPIYIQQIQKMMIDGISIGEEQQYFEKACQLLSLYLKSKKLKAQMLWFRLHSDDREEAKQGIEVLGNVINESLRKGDMAIPCGENHYMLILLKASKENANRVAERILEKWKEVFPSSLNLPDCEIRSL